MIIRYFLIIVFVITFSMGNTLATTPIMITISSDMDKVIFDGRWSYETEWKRSSLDTLSYDDGTYIQLRTAHQDNFIYVLVDAVSDIYLDKGIDRAMVCFDTNNDKSLLPNSDDYCFVVTLDEKESLVLQGGSLESEGHFIKITSPDGFIGISNVSDENDRYSKIPHTSYEFRIPTDLVGRSDIYGFYLGVYDGYSDKIYSWPQDLISDSILKVPTPSTWGELVSPDKSLLEFEWPMLVILSAFSLTVYLTKFRYR